MIDAEIVAGVGAQTIIRKKRMILDEAANVPAAERRPFDSV